MLRIFNIILIFTLFSYSFAVGADTPAPAASGGASLDQVQQAAINGDPDAEYALGYMYYYGKGITRDEQAATMWIQKAAVQGQPQAIQAMKLLGLDQHATAATTAPKPPVSDNSASVATASEPTTGQPSQPVQATTTSQAPQSVPPQAVQPLNQTTMVEASNVDKGPGVKQNQHYTTGEKRLINAPSGAYTIQLLGAYNKNDVLKLIKELHIQSKSLYYKTSYKGQPWYVLVFGIYKSDAAATAAMKEFPSSMQKLNPWIKSLGSVQQGIRTGVE